MLAIDNLNVYLGKAHILRDVSVSVARSEIVSIIGPNGAGKSTLLRTISGLVKATSGRIAINATNITGKRPREVLKCGVILVPQGRSLFGSLTVRENLLMGAYLHSDSQLVHSALEDVLQIFPELSEKLKERAANLSGGQQQLVALARGLMTGATTMLLDEPSAGVAPKLVSRIAELLVRLRASRPVQILIVEQNVSLALDVSDRTAVLVRGSVAHYGPSAVLKSDRSALVRFFLA